MSVFHQSTPAVTNVESKARAFGMLAKRAVRLIGRHQRANTTERGSVADMRGEWLPSKEPCQQAYGKGVDLPCAPGSEIVSL